MTTKSAPKAEKSEAKPKVAKAPAKKAEAKTESRKATATGGTLKVTQVQGTIARKWDQQATLKGLGLGKRHRTRVLQDTPEIRGMVHKVRHLVKVES